MAALIFDLIALTSNLYDRGQNNNPNVNVQNTTMATTTVSRPLTILTRCMQWSSAVIVLGITSYFIHNYHKGEHIIYQEVISAISVAFFMPAFVSPFMPNILTKYVTPIDFIFSYLWLTAFVFAAQDYNWHKCKPNAPPGASCSLKKANESFIFLTFIFTIFAIYLELFNFWVHRQENDVATTRRKYGGNQPGNGAGNGAGMTSV